MKTEQAIGLLIDAVNLAQSRGAYNMKESATILNAVEKFTTNQDNTMETTTNEALCNPVEETTVVGTPTGEVATETNEVAGEAESAPSEVVPESPEAI